MLCVDYAMLACHSLLAFCNVGMSRSAWITQNWNVMPCVDYAMLECHALHEYYWNAMLCVDYAILEYHALRRLCDVGMSCSAWIMQCWNVILCMNNIGMPCSASIMQFWNAMLCLDYAMLECHALRGLCNVGMPCSAWILQCLVCHLPDNITWLGQWIANECLLIDPLMVSFIGPIHLCPMGQCLANEVPTGCQFIANDNSLPIQWQLVGH